ncbi:MAG TPA: MarC family protein [Holophaga sp.]|nr:MarC family protein [Holophaga sp.]HPS68527.1 MarC family protein [Holophaga sp.]
MNEYLRFALVTFPAVFFIMDPLGLLPIFMAITASDTPEKRRDTARRATLLAFGLMTFFTLFGSFVFKLFGISMSALKVAGGILLLMTSTDMLRAQPSRTRSSPEETHESEAKEDVAVVPLAMPLLAGPGSIATAMVLAARGPHWSYAIPVVASIAVTCLVAYLLLRAAARLTRLLGTTGLAVLERIMGLLLAAIAVQFVADGVMMFMQR